MQAVLQTEKSSRLTSRMMTFLKGISGLTHGVPILAGLPAGAIRTEHGELVLASTCCTVGLFDHQMVSVAKECDVDVVVMRHGLHPETLDAVHYDAVVRSGNSYIHLKDLHLYHHPRDGFWLVPAGVGPFITFTPDGLALCNEPPFVTWSQKVEGVCRAAKLTIYAAAGRSGQHD